jgi:hypothetical protein
MNNEENNADGIASANTAEFQDKVCGRHQIVCLFF